MDSLGGNEWRLEDIVLLFLGAMVAASWVLKLIDSEIRPRDT